MNKLKEYWEELYDINGKHNYGGDYNDGMRKVPLTVVTVLRFHNDNYKLTQIFSYLSQFGFHDLPDMKIVDLGCGNGHDMRRLCDIGARPENCYGVDFSENAIKYCRYNSPKKMNFTLGDIANTKLPSNTFDMGLLLNTLANIDDDETIRAMDKEAARIMKVNSILFVILTNTIEDAYLSDKPTLSKGVNIPQRMYTDEEVSDLFPSFKIEASCVVSIHNLPSPKTLYVLRRKYD